MLWFSRHKLPKFHGLLSTMTEACCRYCNLGEVTKTLRVLETLRVLPIPPLSTAVFLAIQLDADVLHGYKSQG